jgi:ABC-type transport system involved in cytochrome c biogenesis permease component
VAAAAAGGGRRRGLGIVAAAGYLPLVPYLGLPVLIPLAILAASALCHALSRPRRTGDLDPLSRDAA